MFIQLNIKNLKFISNNEDTAAGLEVANDYQAKEEIFAFHQNQLAIPERKHNQEDTFIVPQEYLETMIKGTYQVDQEESLAKGLNCSSQDHIEVNFDISLQRYLELEVVHSPSRDYAKQLELPKEQLSCFLNLIHYLIGALFLSLLFIFISIYNIKKVNRISKLQFD